MLKERKETTARPTMSSLEKIVRIIDQGEAGKEVALPLKEAAVFLRIKTEVLSGMGKRKQGLEIEVTGDLLSVRLKGTEEDRRYAYRYLYLLIQGMGKGMEEFLVRGLPAPEILLREIPDFAQIVEVAKGGRSFIPEEDWSRLIVYLFSNWLALKDRSNLPDPAQVLNSIAY